MGDKWCLDNEQTMKDSAGGKQGSKLDCCDPIATEEALIQSAPLPHERVLFWGSGSPQAWRVLIVLEEKNILYRGVCVTFSSGVLKSPFFRSINPRMRVPVLIEPMDKVTGSRTTLYECSAILEYVERTYPGRPCMPSSSNLARFAIAEMRFHESNELLSVLGDLITYLRRVSSEERNQTLLNKKLSQVEVELNLWESYLTGNAFLVDSNQPYLCDFTLFTNLAYAVRCGLQLDGLYPRLAMLYTRICARPSVQNTWPPHWKLTEGTKILCS
uniref:Uncharacterized protein AlNc14C44G3608 n=1 Tax=Albugo laibachii Nc14 TaxID=890382 RepID=F0WA78_9STRA|nr:conserved hypothetical protein [Albugo laibachii Nc14]|eukprot:CCA18048.1 conserved hypothetical protein [Albugo laibachii Nc14]